jgi:hypothetical protein
MGFFPDIVFHRILWFTGGIPQKVQILPYPGLSSFSKNWQISSNSMAAR